MLALYNEPTDVQLIHKSAHSSYMFRHYRVILRELVVITVLSYISMSITVFGNTIIYCACVGHCTKL
jgi:hypothetical protein